MELSVMDIAALCGVARSTVSYWIAKGGLPAHRAGKKYTVQSEALADFLRETARFVPAALGGALTEPESVPRVSLPACWQGPGGGLATERCRTCPVRVNRLPVCMGQVNSQEPDSDSMCADCAYYQRHLHPRLAFIHQLAQPAMIVCEHAILSANAALGRLCGMGTRRLMGLGVEHLLQGASMKKWLVYQQRRLRQESGVPQRFHATVGRRDQLPISTIFHLGALLDPPGSWLVLVDVPADTPSGAGGGA